MSQEIAVLRIIAEALATLDPPTAARVAWWANAAYNADPDAQRRLNWWARLSPEERAQHMEGVQPPSNPAAPAAHCHACDWRGTMAAAVEASGVESEPKCPGCGHHAIDAAPDKEQP